MGLAMSVLLLLYGGVRTGSLRLPLTIVATYLVSGAVGGLVFGLCVPYAQSRIGAALVGIVVMAPLFAGLATLDAYLLGDTGVGWGAYIFATIMVGTIAGSVVREMVFGELAKHFSSPEQRERDR